MKYKGLKKLHERSIFYCDLIDQADKKARGYRILGQDRSALFYNQVEAEKDLAIADRYEKLCMWLQNRYLILQININQISSSYE